MLIRQITLSSGLLLTFGMLRTLAMEIGEHPCAWMVAWSFIQLRVFLLLVLVAMYLPVNLLCGVLLGRRLRSMGMLGWEGVVLLLVPTVQTVQWAEFWGAIMALQA